MDGSDGRFKMRTRDLVLEIEAHKLGENWEQYLDSLEDLMSLYQRMNDIDGRVKVVKSELETSKGISGEVGLRVKTRLEQYNDAVEVAVKYLKAAKELGHHQEIIQAYFEISSAHILRWESDYSKREDIQSAKKALKEAALVLKTSDFSKEKSDGIKADLMLNLAVVLKHEKDYLRAEKLSLNALRLYKKRGKPLDEAKTLYNMALIYNAQGDFDNFTKCIKSEQKIYAKMGNLESQARSLIDEGIICKYYRKYDEALEALKLGKEMYDKLEKDTYVSSERAQIVGHINHIEKIQRMQLDVARISDSIFQTKKVRKSRDLFDLLGERSILYMKLKLYNEAIRDLKEQRGIAEELSLSNFKKEHNVILLGKAYILNKQYEEASKIYKQALSQLSPVKKSRCIILYNLGSASKILGMDKEYLLSIFEEVYSISKYTSNLRFQKRALSVLVELYAENESKLQIYTKLLDNVNALTNDTKHSQCTQLSHSSFSDLHSSPRKSDSGESIHTFNDCLIKDESTVSSALLEPNFATPLHLASQYTRSTQINYTQSDNQKHFSQLAKVSHNRKIICVSEEESEELYDINLPDPSSILREQFPVENKTKSPAERTPPRKPLLRIKVVVKASDSSDEIYAIPCYNGPNGTPKTVNWLIEETERRYYTIHKSHASFSKLTTINLQSKDREIIGGRDIVADVLEDNQKVYLN